MIFELREALSNHMFTCFHTNYLFEHSGVILNDYTELTELDLSVNPKIFMRPTKYDEKSARTHIKRFVNLLETPQVLTNNTRASTRKVEESKSAQRSRSNSTVDEATDYKAQAAMSEQDERLKKNYEDFMEVIKSHQSQSSADYAPPKHPNKPLF